MLVLKKKLWNGRKSLGDSIQSLYFPFSYLKTPLSLFSVSSLHLDRKEARFILNFSMDNFSSISISFECFRNFDLNFNFDSIQIEWISINYDSKWLNSLIEYIENFFFKNQTLMIDRFNSIEYVLESWFSSP